MAVNYESKDERPYADGREARIWHLYVGDVNARLSNYKGTLLKILEERSVQTVYDCACGTGIDSVMLLEEGYNVVSTDAVDDFLEKARQTKQKREELADWQIGFGDWLDLKSAEVDHPAVGYDAIVCIGNSFCTLPDFEGGNKTLIKALQNFKDLLKKGGMLIIDHRNYDYTLVHKTFPPNSHGSIYYNSDRVFNIKADLVEEEGVAAKMTFRSDMDVSGTELEEDPDIKLKERDGKMVPTLELNNIPCYPHTLKGFTALLKTVFGEKAEHRLLPDFRENGQEDFVPNYWVHVIVNES